MVPVAWCPRCARSRLRSLFSPGETRRDHSAKLGAIIANHNCISLQNPYKTRVSFVEFAAYKPIISLDPYKKFPRYRRRAAGYPLREQKSRVCIQISRAYAGIRDAETQSPRGCCGNPGICLKCAQGQKSLKGLPRATHCTDRAQTSGNVSPRVESCPPHPTFGTKVRARRDVPEGKKNITLIDIHIHINTSAVSSIILGSMLIFASCVIHRPLFFPTVVVRVNINSNLVLFVLLAGSKRHPCPRGGGATVKQVASNGRKKSL